jgi:cytoskeletal protein RodZ
MALEQIGQKLKTARDGLGLSLSQIHERTKIPFNHLQSIDNGLSDDLPEPVYVSGFIKRYAECVGLNGPQLVAEYKEEVEGTPHTNGRFGFLAKGLKEQQPVAASPPTNYFNRTRIEQPPPNPMKTFVVPVFWIVLVLVILIFVFSHQQTMEVAQDPSVLSLKDSAAKISTASMPPAAPPEPAAAPTPPADPTPPPSNDARIVLTGNRHVWVTVKSESTGETKFTGCLETGDRRDFQDSEGLRVTADSGGNLSVEVGGKTETFGAAGKKTERLFMAKNASPPAQTADNQTKSPAAKTTTNTTASTKKPTVNKKSLAAARDRVPKRADVPSRDYMPGENLGSGSRTIDVPYRY